MALGDGNTAPLPIQMPSSRWIEYDRSRRRQELAAAHWTRPTPSQPAVPSRCDGRHSGLCSLEATVAAEQRSHGESRPIESTTELTAISAYIKCYDAFLNYVCDGPIQFASVDSWNRDYRPATSNHECAHSAAAQRADRDMKDALTGPISWRAAALSSAMLAQMGTAAASVPGMPTWMAEQHAVGLDSAHRSADMGRNTTAYIGSSVDKSPYSVMNGSEVRASLARQGCQQLSNAQLHATRLHPMHLSSRCASCVPLHARLG
jgi:hypothetical protein